MHLGVEEESLQTDLDSEFYFLLNDGPKRFSQSALNYLICDLGLSKDDVEFLESRHKVSNNKRGKACCST